jgi:heme A synthase
MFSKETIFALSLFPYLGFLWCLSRSKQAPRLAEIGFYLTLLFVAVTIPAGLWALKHYGQPLANVDFLHGGAEAFLTLANICVALGFGRALRQAQSR